MAIRITRDEYGRIRHITATGEDAEALRRFVESLPPALPAPSKPKPPPKPVEDRPEPNFSEPPPED
jgi:hypothetical protein